MKKRLLILLLSAVSISASMAQSVRTAPAGIRSIALAKPARTYSLLTPAMKEASLQKVPFSPLVSNTNAKVMSSVSKGDKKFQIVKNADGTFAKRIVVNNAHQKLHREATGRLNRSAAAGATLFESFEGWDGENPDWIPANWTKESKAGNSYVPGQENLTWHTTDANPPYVTPTDGDYMGWVSFPFPFDDEGNLIETPAQDEWLISPSFTPVAGDYLTFDVNYAAIFMFLDLASLDTDMANPVFTVKALISTDDGATWTTLWDAAKDEGYTEDNIWDYTDNEWYSKTLPLESYVGKPVKIAFNYVGKDGDNVGLDNITVRGLNPVALYMRPQGYFKAGLTQDWGYYEVDLMLGPAYESGVWRNLSKESDAYRWNFDNPDGSGNTITSTEENPSISYPYDMFEIPTLTATGEGKSSTYRWGTYDERYLMAGGNMSLDDATFIGVGNYDLTYDFVPYTLDEEGKSYAFGTTADNSIEGVANYFEKPVHKYILSGVWAALGDFSFPAGTEFTMVIHRVVDGSVDDDDIIATATCTAQDVKAVDNNAYTMPFTKFITIDPETQLEVENDYLEIEDAILIEIKGFNAIPGSKICFYVQEMDADPTGENNAYIYTPDRELYGYRGATSLIFSLEATYSFLLADTAQWSAPEGGGEKTFNVTSLFSPDGWWMDEPLPEWLSDDIQFNSDTWDIQYTLKADPLPAGTPSREAVVKIETFGADMSIRVQQGKNTGLSTVTVAARTKVVNKNNRFELTYSPDYSKVSVYTVTGQKVAGYSLPAGGTFAIPGGNYPKGVYLFSFTGTKGFSTVKVLK